MNHAYVKNSDIVSVIVILVLSLLLSACADGRVASSARVTAQETSAPVVTLGASQPAAGPARAEAQPVVIESGGDVPFYARFGENETFDNEEWTLVVFYRPPECIPVDFNLNQFFHFPGDSGPGAFACTPPTTTSVETWESGPQTDTAPLISKMTGRGAVPVWFLANDEVESAAADGVVTIVELRDLPSRLVGTASTYTELLHPTQSNAKPLIQFSGEGQLADGRAFMLSVSKGAEDVTDHVTINFSTGE